MLFTQNNKQIATQSITPTTYITNESNPFSARYRRSHQPVVRLATVNQHISTNRELHTRYLTNSPIPPIKVNRRVEISSESTNTGNSKKMKWGKPTWFLFHVIAEKIKPEYYSIYRREILNIIKMICNTLPCPICANHASEYMKNVTETKIHTKQDLQNLLWEFHNVVNQRKGYPQFAFNELSEQYSKLNTHTTISTFLLHHSDKQGGFRLVADSMYKKSFIKTLRIWFINHISIFDK